jgi:hypothetical protein
MHLEIPDNAHVVINIGHAPLPVLTDETGTLAMFGALRRPMRPLLMVAIAAVAFGVGHIIRFGHDGTSGGAVSALASAPFAPQLAPTAHPSPAETQIPPSFQQGLNQPPRVTPAPDQAGTTIPAKNPFGLDN